MTWWPMRHSIYMLRTSMRKKTTCKSTMIALFVFLRVLLMEMKPWSTDLRSLTQLSATTTDNSPNRPRSTTCANRSRPRLMADSLALTSSHSAWQVRPTTCFCQTTPISTHATLRTSRTTFAFAQKASSTFCVPQIFTPAATSTLPTQPSTRDVRTNSRIASITCTQFQASVLASGRTLAARSK